MPLKVRVNSTTVVDVFESAGNPVLTDAVLANVAAAGVANVDHQAGSGGETRIVGDIDVDVDGRVRRLESANIRVTAASTARVVSNASPADGTPKGSFRVFVANTAPTSPGVSANPELARASDGDIWIQTY